LRLKNLLGLFQQIGDAPLAEIAEGIAAAAFVRNIDTPEQGVQSILTRR
jgi:hypothetical protein